MASRFQCRLLLVCAAGLVLAACSSRTGVPQSQPERASMQVHARAAQRIVLPGATAAEEAGAGAAPAVGNRVQPETPEVLRFPDGTVGVRVAQQYFDTIVACRLPDGSYTTQCPRGQEPRP